VVIEAVQWLGKNYAEIDKFMTNVPHYKYFTGVSIFIDTLEGTMAAGIKDYIIKGVKGEFYPCKEEIFEKTYEEVNE
jgi:hypothetical protein